MNDFDFSLIFCTIHRTDEPADFLKSLASQGNSFRIQLIVVDQNSDNRLDEILAPYHELFHIEHLHCKPGLSKARNAGLEKAAGKIVAFPDDDCTYPPDLLKNVSSAFRKNLQHGCISGVVMDHTGKKLLSRMKNHSCEINRKNVWRGGMSTAIFVRNSAIGELRFDEALGVGSGTIFGSGEETDFLLNLLEKDVRILYTPGIIVHHPLFLGPWKTDRAWRYGCGFGYVLKKHGDGFPAVCFYAGLQLVRAAQAFFTLKWRKMLFHIVMAAGRMRGFFAEKS